MITDQNDLGGALTSHPDVRKVAFTGSTATGKKVMESVSNTLKRLTLELGGNDAAIVLDDVDVKDVASKVFTGATMNSGQVCLAIKRLYVHESQYDQMCDELAKCAQAAVVDDGLKQGTQMGPSNNKAAIRKGARLSRRCQEERQDDRRRREDEPQGLFHPADHRARYSGHGRVWCRKSNSRPILPVMKYKDVNDAIKRANDTQYGLGGTVWSKDMNRRSKSPSRSRSGTVWVNKHLDLPADMPFGGAKQSGFGKEMGREGLEEYTQSKIINMAK